MSDFGLYFSLGKDHILDIRAYDHILFVIAMCVIYQFSEWKRVLVLVTAFTIGHSLTLGLVTLDLISFDSSIVEFLIPVTILITAANNIIHREKDFRIKNSKSNYSLALFFGLIHGMGFSNYLKAIVGGDSDIIWELFAFNIGLEMGQILIVLIFLGIAYVMTTIFNMTRKDWILAVCSAVSGVAITLIIETKFW